MIADLITYLVIFFIGTYVGDKYGGPVAVFNKAKAWVQSKNDKKDPNDP